VLPNVTYQGDLAMDTIPGTRIPARYTGYHQAYALRSSHTWAWDALIMLLIGGAVGFLLWLTPVGMGQRSDTTDPHGASAFPPGAQL
jgi:hypothetical protein